MSETRNADTTAANEASQPGPGAPPAVRPVIPAAAAKRANASVIGMLLALLVSLAVVLPVVLLNAHPKAESFRPPVDVAAAAAQARDTAGFTAAAALLPGGWSANYARWNSAGTDGVPFWEVGYVTPSQQFISLTQTAEANPTWLAQRTGDAPVTGDRAVGATDWELRDKPGADKSLILNYRGTTLILSGTADLKEFDVLAAAAVRSVDAGGTGPATGSATSTGSTTGGSK
ncbi:MAG: DUF4245 domain-containing protein [Actinomycetota bacterium]|nr:DUF4245 domain-containing protein [Actinomycetota bacterium]